MGKKDKAETAEAALDRDMLYSMDRVVGRSSGKSTLRQLVVEAASEVSFRGQNQPFEKKSSNPFALDMSNRYQNPLYVSEIVDTEFGDARRVNRLGSY